MPMLKKAPLQEPEKKKEVFPSVQSDISHIRNNKKPQQTPKPTEYKQAPRI